MEICQIWVSSFLRSIFKCCSEKYPFWLMWLFHWISDKNHTVDNTTGDVFWPTWTVYMYISNMLHIKEAIWFKQHNLILTWTSTTHEPKSCDTPASTNVKDMQIIRLWRSSKFIQDRNLKKAAQDRSRSHHMMLLNCRLQRPNAVCINFTHFEHVNGNMTIVEQANRHGSRRALRPGCRCLKFSLVKR